jgi:putative oxidoreductase
MIDRFAALSARLQQFPLSILQLAMRLGIAAVFFNSGRIKINSWEFTVLLFRNEYRVPLLDPVLAAQVATALELSVPVLIAIGFATRLATLPLLGMVAVIQIFVFPNAWSEHLMWSSILLFLLTRGPGALSVDHFVSKLRSKSPAGTGTSEASA